MSTKVEVYIRVSKSEAYTSTDIALARVETLADWDKVRRELDNAVEDATQRVSAQLTAENRRRTDAENGDD